MELTGRVALVTGASSGIGEAIALALARRGASVALVARRADELERVRALIAAFGAHAVSIPADLTEDGAIEEAIHTAQAAVGPIDILVNNAAAAKTADVSVLSARRWQLGLRLNLTVPFLAARAVLTGMRERGYGWVVNIGSVGGLRPLAHSAPYSVGKNALNLLTEVIDLENRHLGVRAVAVCPGWVRTPMALDPQLVGVDESELLTPDDIAETVCWIVGRPRRMAVGPIVPVVPTSQHTDVTDNWERFLRDVLGEHPDPDEDVPHLTGPDDAPESLTGRVALVTGASSGIGEAIALALARRGAAVALVARRADELERVRALITDQGSAAVAIPVNLTEDGAIEEAIHTAQAALGPIDILVNNAGIARIAPVHRLSVRQWELALRLNATVPFLAAREVLPGMRERGYGRIVNISSDGASQAYACSAPYSVSKRALNVLTEVIDLENRHLGVRAVAICPGWVRTAMAMDPGLVGVEPSELLTAQDIADTVVWHVLRPARMTAGPVIPVVPVSRRASTAVGWRRSLETPEVQRALAVDRTLADGGVRR